MNASLFTLTRLLPFIFTWILFPGISTANEQPPVEDAFRSVTITEYTNTTLPRHRAPSVSSRHSLHHRPIDFDHDAVWIYDTWLEFTEDGDQDGFYSAFSLILDIDSTAIERSVFVDFYLVAPNGDTDLIYTSQPFSVFGESEADALRVETLLDTGFYADEYDLIIAIYDAESLEPLTDYGYNNEQILYSLPLESQEHDTFYYADSVVQTTTVTSHGGPIGILNTLLMLGLVVVRRWKP